MNRKILTRLLSVLLVVVMTFGLLPVSASAAWWWPWNNTPETQPAKSTEQAVVDTQAATDDDFYRIVHLDCGRKYFSVENIKRLIDFMAKYGYNQLQLAFGNGGLRFVLDDMSLTFGSETLASDTVKNNITNGNNSFNGDTRTLTETQMTTIIEYAGTKSIEIVPMLNMPGHMNWANTSFSSYVSDSALNVAYETARSFAYALLQKYVDYFKGKNCKFFHFGADESGKTGDNMTTFLNGCADIITKADMTPRAFNDATSAATMPASVQITYWHKEKYSKSASELASTNALINTHGRWYYVIKTAQSGETENKYWTGNANKETVSVEQPTKKMGERGDGYYVALNKFFDGANDSISEGSTVDSNKGAMFCIWCDASKDDYLTDTQVISTDENYGALYQLQKLAENYWPTLITKDTIDTGDETNEKTVDLTVGETATFENVTADADAYDTTNAYIATAKVDHVEGVTETTVSTTKATTLENGASYILRYAGSNYALTSNTGGTNWNTSTRAFELYTAAEDDNVWTLEASGNGYKLKSAAGYLAIGYNSATVGTTGDVFTLTYSNSAWSIKDSDDYVIDALGGLTNYYSAGGWNGSQTQFDLYKVTKATEESSTLTITGTGEGQTTVKVGNTTYTINVTAPTTTETKTLNYGASITLPTGAESVEITSGNEYVTFADGKITAGQSNGTATVTFTTKNAGDKVTARYTYTITVTDVDFSGVDDLSVGLWATNAPVGEDGNPLVTGESKTITAEEAYKEEGVLLSYFVPETGYRYKAEGTPEEDMAYWKGTVLHNGLKPSYGGTDLSSSGDDFEKVRYWENNWQYYNGEWKNIVANDTVVAFYMQTFVVSDEIITASRDYGDGPNGQSHGAIGSWNAYYNLIAYAVVYPDGTTSPATESQIYDSGSLRGYSSGNQSIGINYAYNNSDYKVSKITYTWGKNDQTRSWQSSANGGSVTWEKETNEAGDSVYKETLIWSADDPETYGERPMVDGDRDGIYFTEGDSACMIRIYLEVVKKETNLNVVYWDDDNNSQININDIQIAVVDGTTYLNGLKQNSAINAGTFTLDDDAYVTNIANVHQTFNKNVTTVPNIYEKYKSGVFKYDHAEISEDYKTLTLHYVINREKVQKIYVLDFGLPINIPLSDFVENSDNLTNISWNESSLKAGTLVLSSDEKTLTYTPTSTLTETLTQKFTLTYENGDPGTIYIGVTPASNVLYEENFLKTADGDTSWTLNNTDTITTAQQLQKANDTENTYNVFGYDGAYAESKGANGFWKAANLQVGKLTGELKADFYGNAFDLIGNCSPSTGQVVLIIAKQNTKQGVKVAIVDTRYKSEISQVPLAHLELAEGAYTAYVYAGGLEAETISTQGAVYSAPAVFSAPAVSSSDDALTDLLAQYGLTMNDAEYITGDQIASSPIAVQSAPAIATYAADSTITHEKGTHVEIDSFRVYRDTTVTEGTTSIAASYPTNEQNVTYTNIIKLMGNKVITATAENGTVEDVTPTDYQAQGGPQKEIYLAKDQSIVFGVTEANKIQVSLRAVSGTTTWNTSNTISSITEMYYEVAVSDQNTVTITNTGDNLLAIGNVKLPKDVTVTETSNLSDDVILASVRAVYTAAPEPVEETFTPDTFKANATSLRLIRNKVVTLNITVSKDVSYVTVNGKTYTPSRLFSRWVKNATILVTDTIGRNESRTYTIIAYNADGTASEPIVVKG